MNTGSSSGRVQILARFSTMCSKCFEVIFEDSAILVVVKPAGLLTQAPPGIDSLEARIKAWLKLRDQKPGKVYLGVPHRLDRSVSGVMIFAKHSRAARRISKQFERRSVEKIYWACTQGEVAPSSGTWRDYLRKVPGEPKAQIVPQEDSEARLAILHYRTLGLTPHGSWLELRLETGRTHQVRIQAASRGWPLLGDYEYGATIPFGKQHEDPRLRAIALHARSLALNHPMSRERLTLRAPVSSDWRLLLGLSMEQCGAINLP
jgi:RluA family pseudouridine synthase